MRRAVVFGLAASLSVILLFLPATGQAAVVTNLLTDPGFEDYVNPVSAWTYGGSAHWNCDRSHTGAMSLYIGSGWRDTTPSGNAYQAFALPAPVGNLEFGAYFNIVTDTTAGNWDQAQINLQIMANNTTIGESISNFPVTWTAYTDYSGRVRYESGWFLVSGVVDASLLGGAPASINISLQDYSGAVTGLYADDVFVGQAAPVPEPATMILLGSGLIGLAGYGRKKAKK